MSVIETFCFIPHEFSSFLDLSSRLYLTNDPNAKNKKKNKEKEMRENGQPIWPNLRFHVNCSSAHNSWPWIWIFSATIDIPKRRRRIPGNVIRAYTTYYVSEGFVRCYRPCQYNIIHRGTARKKRKGKAIRKRMASEVLTR